MHFAVLAASHVAAVLTVVLITQVSTATQKKTGAPEKTPWISAGLRKSSARQRKSP